MITRSVLAVDLKDDPGLIDRYQAYHRDVWPEVRASLRRAGILNMDIYLLGRRLVMVVDTDGQDYQRCFATHATSHPRVVEWEALMRSLQQPPPGAPPGEWWTQMRPVFSLAAADNAECPMLNAEEP
jgi:L-rhamnose mutarotase